MPTKIPTSRLEAARTDAHAARNLSQSLRDFVALYGPELPPRIVEAVDAMHAETLRASHLVATFSAAALHDARKGGGQ